MKRYDSYKDSGVQWIGEIPSEWDFLKVRHTFFLKGRIGWQGLKADEFIEEGPYLVTGTDFQNGHVNWETCYHISEERYNEAPEIHVKNGDVLITKDGTVGKMAYIENKPEKVSLNSHLLIVRPLLNSICNKYVYWAFQTSSFDYYKGLSQTGSIMESLSQEKIASFIMPYPSLQEQTAIANYLDNKCSKIDNVIATQEKRVELLRELKQSIITRAVTRGINPDAKMKDSGVEWIGEIPEHWEVKKLKYLFANLDYLRQPITADQRSKENPIYDYYGASGVIDKIDFYNVDDTVLLIGEDGANLVFRNLPLIYKASGKFWVNNHAHILKPLAGVDYEYMFYTMECADYSTFITGSAQPKLSQEKMNQVQYPLPPLSEQHQIVTYIEQQTSKLDSSITKALRQIELLKEYKQSLITEVVTGKRKVC